MADCLMTAPPGARLPRSTASDEPGASGVDRRRRLPLQFLAECPPGHSLLVQMEQRCQRAEDTRDAARLCFVNAPPIGRPTLCRSSM
jgi:hypothetical protein